ncbi:MAG: hypothetical protein ACREH9_04500, partial [Pseudomonadota bacterium]
AVRRPGYLPAAAAVARGAVMASASGGLTLRYGKLDQFPKRREGEFSDAVVIFSSGERHGQQPHCPL